ncbi:uncharacterized protein LOC131237265 [Magnolia sinica]|uniref:uncharacterized protein LOC131237265 n=1 Tax=Magnolia sinica TaxID=86752 RepID=UPI00265ABEE3|nr:uncharacterized protein LOC131237265 [Magnolia sinica]
MEALLLPDQSISTYNRIGNRYKNVNNISSRSPGLGPGNSNPAYLLNNINGSLFRLPSSLSSTFSSFHSLQPPLLPLPLAKSPSLPSRNQGLSCPSTKHWKINKTKDQELAPKKAKPTPKKDSSRSAMKSFMIASTNRIGPDPSDLPKQAPKVLKSTSLKVQSLDRLDYSGLIFSLAPPPSSLPLPKFFLRPKTGCNAEAEGIDAGATDDLRRLLRLP